MTKVVLINPPQIQLRQPRAYVPLGICYIGAVLEEKGVDVEVVNLADETLKFQTVTEIINKLPDADVYGITCVSATYREVVKLSRMLKADGKKVIIGGAHPSVLPQDTWRDTRCDIVVVGEAESVIYNIVVGRREGSRIIDAGVVTDLDSLPIPDRHLFPEEDFIDVSGIHGQPEGTKATVILSSRGCPYSCTFCCKIPQTRGIRYQSPERTIKEMLFLIDMYGVEHFRITDEIFTVSRARVMKLCNLLVKEKIGVTWVCITRPDTIDEELLKTMKQAGCIEMHLGIESGSQRILDIMNKKTTVKENLTAVRKIKSAGIGVKIYLIHGFPGETAEDVDATVRFFRDSGADKFTLSQFVYNPGSEIWRSPDAWFYPDGDTGYAEAKMRLEVVR